MLGGHQVGARPQLPRKVAESRPPRMEDRGGRRRRRARRGADQHHLAGWPARGLHHADEEAARGWHPHVSAHEGLDAAHLASSSGQGGSHLWGAQCGRHPPQQVQAGAVALLIDMDRGVRAAEPLTPVAEQRELPNAVSQLQNALAGGGRSMQLDGITNAPIVQLLGTDRGSGAVLSG